MPFILNIDTAIETASICLAKEGDTIALLQNNNQKDHAAWIHIAIQKMMHDAGCSMQDLMAVAVSAGPGSYTGLRVGMSTAKGLCYALKIPLIAISTLKMMAYAAQTRLTIQSNNHSTLLCPMIDARRMEVFTAIYNNNLDEIQKPQICILDESVFDEFLNKDQQIIFFGNGSIKFQSILKHQNAIFADVICNASHLANLSYANFTNNVFADLPYSEPFYMKEFYFPARKLF